ncbi:MAG: PhoH family protein [Bacillota bacterium]
MRKYYVLDTNVLLHNPGALFLFEENNVVLPFTVVEEIDNQKKRQDEIGQNARAVSRELDLLRDQGNLADGVTLENGGRLWIELNHQTVIDIPRGLDPDKHDNRILAVAYNLSKEKKGKVILVTKDLNLRIKADVLGIPAEDFYNDKVDYDRLFTGAGALEVADADVDQLYRGGELAAPVDGYPNQFFILKGRENSSHSALSRYGNGKFWPLRYGESVNWGIKARNKEQKFALELLINDDIKVVTLVGRAGTGKTLLALAVGLEKVLEMRAYSRLLITRPVIPMGNDLGFLPGTKEEKLRPWMQPIYDNMELLFANSEKPARMMDDLMQRGVLEIEALTYIRGRSIPNQYVICDEAQNLSPHMIKTLITRVGEGTKIIFTGDPEQIDHPYLDSSSNGLTYLVEKLKEEEISGHIVLVKGERSKVAELGAKLL